MFSQLNVHLPLLRQPFRSLLMLFVWAFLLLNTGFTGCSGRKVDFLAGHSTTLSKGDGLSNDVRHDVSRNNDNGSKFKYRLEDYAGRRDEIMAKEDASHNEVERFDEGKNRPFAGMVTKSCTKLGKGAKKCFSGAKRGAYQLVEGWSDKKKKHHDKRIEDVRNRYRISVDDNKKCYFERKEDWDKGMKAYIDKVMPSQWKSGYGASAPPLEVWAERHVWFVHLKYIEIEKHFAEIRNFIRDENEGVQSKWSELVKSLDRLWFDRKGDDGVQLSDIDLQDHIDKIVDDWSSLQDTLHQKVTEAFDRLAQLCSDLKNELNADLYVENQPYNEDDLALSDYDSVDGSFEYDSEFDSVDERVPAYNRSEHERVVSNVDEPSITSCDSGIGNSFVSERDQSKSLEVTVL